MARSKIDARRAQRASTPISETLLANGSKVTLLPPGSPVNNATRDSQIHALLAASAQTQKVKVVAHRVGNARIFRAVAHRVRSADPTSLAITVRVSRASPLLRLCPSVFVAPWWKQRLTSTRASRHSV
jgi:hypothetical protein